MTNTTAPQLNGSFPSVHSATALGRNWFPARRAELVEAAEVSTDLATTLMGYGDVVAARELLESVRGMLAEVALIDGLR